MGRHLGHVWRVVIEGIAAGKLRLRLIFGAILTARRWAASAHILFLAATPVPLSRPNSAPDEFLKFR
jgi:hypothetical protein